MPHNILFGVNYHFFRFLVASHEVHFDVGDGSIFLNCPNSIVIVISDREDIHSASRKIPVSYKILIFISSINGVICSLDIRSFCFVSILKNLPFYIVLWDWGSFIGICWIGAEIFNWFWDFIVLCYFGFGVSIYCFLKIRGNFFWRAWVIDNSFTIWYHLLVSDNLNLFWVTNAVAINRGHFNCSRTLREGFYSSVVIDWNDSLWVYSPMNSFFCDNFKVIGCPIIISTEKQNF